jgi:Na+/melibiose symporter-like transporter
MVFMVGMLLFVRVATSFFEIPSLALAPELAPGYDERTSLLAWRFLFLVVGGAAINAILYQVFLRQDASNPLGLLNKQRYADFSVFAAILVFLVIVGSTLATHRRIKYLYVPDRKAMSLGRTFKDLAATFSNRPLLILMFTNLLIAIAAGVTSGLQSYMFIHLWRLKPQDIGYLLIFAPFASLIALWATPRASARFGKKPVMLGLYGSWLVTAVIPFSIWLLGLAPAGGSVALLVFLGADLFIGVGFAVGVHIILNSMLSDASEDIAVQSEQRAEGVMFAAYGLLAKWGTGIGAFLAGVLLSVVKFPAKAVPGTVSMDLMRNLVLVNLPTITVFNLAAIVCVSFYALDRTKHEQNLAVLRARAAPAPTSASAG